MFSSFFHFLLLLTLLVLIFFLCNPSSPPPTTPPPKEKLKNDLAFFFSAFMSSSEKQVTVLLIGHTSLQGERWWCQLSGGEKEEEVEECLCSVNLLGLRNFKSDKWGVQKLECTFKSKGHRDINSIRLGRKVKGNQANIPFFFLLELNKRDVVKNYLADFFR